VKSEICRSNLPIRLASGPARPLQIGHGCYTSSSFQEVAVNGRLLPAALVGSLCFTTAYVAAPWASIAAQAPSATATQVAERPERVDLDAIYRIKEEGLQRSQVMDTLWFLTDVSGPRLTNSPAMYAAAKWATDRLASWGLSRVREEEWGPFGRGWENQKFTANVISPQPFPLIAFPRAWTPGTGGTVTADVITMLVNREDQFRDYAGKVKGKVVLIAPETQVNPLFDAIGHRFTDQELSDMQSQQVAVPRARRGGGPPAANQAVLGQQLMTFLAGEGAVATLQPAGGRNDHGVILVSNAPNDYRDPKVPVTLPQIMVASEHYNRIARLVEKNVPVRIELNAQNRFVDDRLTSVNIVAEIPGTDRADELVMLGAHFDSWHAGTGATDNAAGSAAMMEAMRILKTTGVRLRRTVRLVLWTGEEQGLLGSRAYVKQQFGDPETMQLKPAHEKVSAYFNMDNGSGAIRGVYLQGNEAVRPIFSAWMEPFRNLGMTTLTIRNTGGTDHLSFDEVGIPGFQFVQDPLEYSSDSHHTNMDLYDRAQAADLMKNSVIIASFVYHAANRDELLPRKTLPRPRNGRGNVTQ